MGRYQVGQMTLYTSRGVGLGKGWGRRAPRFPVQNRKFILWEVGLS